MKRYFAEITEIENIPNFKYIKDISTEDFSQIEKFIKVIDETEHLMDLFLVHKLNFQDLIDFQITGIENILDGVTNLTDIGKEKYTFLKIEINRIVINYLSSFRMFIDHCDRKIAKRFGKESQEYSNFKSLTNQAYDNTFVYRFVYKLRNFCQHCGIPVTDLNINNLKDIVQLEFQFERDYLLNEYEEWGIKVKTDLKNMNEKTNINQVFKVHFSIIEKLSERIHNIYEIKFMDALKNLNNFRNPDRNQNEIVVITENQDTVLGKQITITKFPNELINKFINGIC
ncbi:MAG: hypothetical protein KGZ87_04595 [Bacteroidetes bacterium]|nr:hypothetical protein [Bacteroidota bacterium]